MIGHGDNGMVWQSNTIFIGGGINNPGVVALNVDTNDTRKLLDLPLLNSVYAMDLDLINNKLAIGTKGGLVYILSVESREITEKDSLAYKLVQGASVLSACWVGESYLAVSDTAGRCLLWHTNIDKSPKVLGTFEDVICSLLNIDENILAGLSSKGRLYFWEAFEGKLIKTLNVPGPPSISGLVKLVYWQEEYSIVFPNSMGRLTLFDLKKDTAKSINAHKGDFYAISTYGDRLLTIGMQDRRLKIWSKGYNESDCEIIAPEGVVSLAVAGERHQKLLIVDTKGKASVYQIKNDKLHFLSHLPGRDYRVVISPDPEKLQRFIFQKKESEARQITSEIQANTGQLDDNTIKKLHTRLVELGYEHLSLEIRTEHAYKNKDIIGSLKYAFSLMKLLPQKEVFACNSMERYAALLERTWHISEADAVCKSISNIDPDYPFVMQTNYIEWVGNIIRDNYWMIDPDIPIHQIIESATIIEKQFYGRYVIRKLDPEPCYGVSIPADRIVEKYEYIRNESAELKLPSATAEHVWWISSSEIQQIQLVTFLDEPNQKVSRSQFALQVFGGNQGTVVVPVVLFDYRNADPKISVKMNNEKALEEFSKIKQSPLTTNYLTSVHQTLIQALRLLVTEGLSKRGIYR